MQLWYSICLDGGAYVVGLVDSLSHARKRSEYPKPLPIALQRRFKGRILPGENDVIGAYQSKSARPARRVKMGGQREMDGDTADELLGTCGVSI